VAQVPQLLLSVSRLVQIPLHALEPVGQPLVGPESVPPSPALEPPQPPKASNRAERLAKMTTAEELAWRFDMGFSLQQGPRERRAATSVGAGLREGQALNIGRRRRNPNNGVDNSQQPSTAPLAAWIGRVPHGLQQRPFRRILAA
jgi:hypothetical protein